jgi:hypothetical protein
MAGIENMNFQNRNDHPGQSSCAYQAAAEVISQRHPGLLAWGVKELCASSRPKGIPAKGSCDTLEDSEPSKAKWSFIQKEFAPVRRHSRLVLLLAAALPLSAASTNICESNLAAPDGSPLAGGLRDGVGILITPSAPFSAADGSRVDQVPARVRVVNGAFCVALEPNDTAVPSGSWYVARWQLAGAAPRTECWYVPTSGTALGLNAVVVSCANPTPGCAITSWLGLGAKTWDQVDGVSWEGLLCQ